MLAPSELPARYAQWNARHGAPFGHPIERYVPRAWRLRAPFARAVGPFAFQRNNDIRAFEYPWAYEAIGPRPGLRVLELGGGLSGLQFVLAREGCEVVNVDPGEAARGRGWPVDADTIGRLGRAFRAPVRLEHCTLAEAGLPDASFDRVVSISVIEHVPHDELYEILRDVRRVLRPGGRFVLTVDLFLDLVPFTDVERNEFGTNVSIRDLVEASGLAVRVGEPAELYGFDGFDPASIRGASARYLIGRKQPTMVQALVLEKPS